MGKRRWIEWFLLSSILIIVALVVRHLKTMPPAQPSETSNLSAKQDALQELPDISLKKPSFAPVVPIKFRVEKHREIPLLIDGNASDPAVSPDGSEIALLVTSNSETKIAIVNLTADNITPLLLGLDEYGKPSWSPDGRKIAFSGAKGNIREIYVYDIKSQKLSQITNDPQRNKSHPAYGPYSFDDYYRISYVSEEKGREDIWWVRESGENDKPITFSPARLDQYKKPELWTEYDHPPDNMVETGGDFPEWSPGGNIIIYKAINSKYEALSYSYLDWWINASITIPSTKGILTWSPNQRSFIEYIEENGTVYILNRDNLKKRQILSDKKVTSMPSYFPDGKGLAYIHKKGGKSVLSIEPLDDPLGDVVNLWMYPYTYSQKEKMEKNHMLLFKTNSEQIYNIYESEFYTCGSPDDSEHARPYLVTSDAVLETFYITFSTLLTYVERQEFSSALKEFAAKGLETTRAKKYSRGIEQLFMVGLGLIDPDKQKEMPAETRDIIEKITTASGVGKPVFGMEIDYADFFIRGKYERDKDLQSYFRALKWFQTFTFDLRNETERKAAAELIEVLSSPTVTPSLERINSVLKDAVGESRYYTPMTLKSIPADGSLPNLVVGLPWVAMEPKFKIFPSIYTMDAFIFDELITHTERADTVGTIENPRLLPVGMDIMASFGSSEARKILVEELKEGRFENYEKKLDETMMMIKGFSAGAWDRNIYQAWLDMLKTLVKDPDERLPDFARLPSWQRKQINTALGSWVNLRYETVAYVEQVAAECGEGGYERLNIGYPKGYVEPNPLFFRKLDNSFGRISELFRKAISDPTLRESVLERIDKYRVHLKRLEGIAQKELDGTPLTDEEYGEILYIGRTIEHFILIMNSLNSVSDGNVGGLARPDPIMKVVDVQKSPLDDTRLYEALGPVSEINVAVPYYGRRQIVKGPVYSYYEFRSLDLWSNDKWQKGLDKAEIPIWIRDYYEGSNTAGIPKQ